jgi:hypothetical protein
LEIEIKIKIYIREWIQVNIKDKKKKLEFLNIYFEYIKKINTKKDKYIL